MAQSFNLKNADYKKGEITTLRDALLEAINKRDVNAQIEVMKRVIQSMTSGSDLSDLMDTIIMSSQTQSLSHKKMVYQYLTTYARFKEDTVILVLASLQKDALDKNPRIRGLALRTMCSLHTPTLVDHMLPSLEKGLTDQIPYVRQVAIIAVLKLWKINPKIFTSSIQTTLERLIQDDDPHVMCNVVRVLNEILAGKGGIKITIQLVLRLLSNLHKLTIWGQCFILGLLKNFKPSTEEDLLSVMNFLDSRLSHQNSGIVFHTVDFYLRLTETRPDLYKDVCVRIKSPIITTLLRGLPEIQYTALSHLLILSKRVPGLLGREYKLYYVNRAKDPEYLKIAKVNLLESIAASSYVKDIILELEDYLIDKDKRFAKEAIKAICRLAIKIPICASQAFNVLLSASELYQMPHVVDTSLICVQDLLTKFPDSAKDVVPRLGPSLSVVKDTNAIAMIVTMLGNFGHNEKNSVSLLANLISDWDNQADTVKTALIFATLKLFFHNPPSVHSTLVQMLQLANDDFSSPDVHDRALFFSRLLSVNIDKCKKIVNLRNLQQRRPDNMVFAEDIEDSNVDFLFDEFNSLSVIYKQNSERFIRKDWPSSLHVEREAEKEREKVQQQNQSVVQAISQSNSENTIEQERLRYEEEQLQGAYEDDGESTESEEFVVEEA